MPILSSRDRYLNVRNTILTLFDFGVIPIINENDTVSVEELRFGDNDTLGALITNMIDAEMFIILTDVGGLYTGQSPGRPGGPAGLYRGPDRPRGRGHGRQYPQRPRHRRHASQDQGGQDGGGQRRLFLHRPGQPPGHSAATCSAANLVGTFFLPKPGQDCPAASTGSPMSCKPQGFLVLDDGACRALVERGKSLLPSGILKVEGSFGVGAPVHCRDTAGRVIAAGLTNYSSADIEQIKGRRSSEIKEMLGFNDSEEVIHRDNLVLLDAGDATADPRGRRGKGVGHGQQRHQDNGGRDGQAGPGASRPLAAIPAPVKDRVLLRTAEALVAQREAIIAQNELDLAAGRAKGLSAAMLDRLTLSDKVISSMVQGLREVAALPDPVGEVEQLKRRPSGITVGRMRVPLGVVGDDLRVPAQRDH